MDLNKYLGRDFVISVLSRNLLTYRNLHGSSINADNNIMVIKEFTLSWTMSLFWKKRVD